MAHSAIAFDAPIASSFVVNSRERNFVSVMFAWMEMKRSIFPDLSRTGLIARLIQYGCPSLL